MAGEREASPNTLQELLPVLLLMQQHEDYLEVALGGQLLGFAAPLTFMCIYKHSDPKRGWSTLLAGTGKIQREKCLWPRQARRPTTRWVTQSEPTSPKSQASLDDQIVASCPHRGCAATHWVSVLMKHILEKERPMAPSARVARGMQTKTEPLVERMSVLSLANSHCHVPAAACRYLVCQQAIDIGI